MFIVEVGKVGLRAEHILRVRVPCRHTEVLTKPTKRGQGEGVCVCVCVCVHACARVGADEIQFCTHKLRCPCILLNEATTHDPNNQQFVRVHI